MIGLTCAFQAYSIQFNLYHKAYDKDKQDLNNALRHEIVDEQSTIGAANGNQCAQPVEPTTCCGRPVPIQRAVAFFGVGI